MREIKFRAWANYSKKMFFPNDEFFLTEGKLDSIPNTILMQFTGLLDTKGKEIYEGDILQFKCMYPQDFQDRNPYKKYNRICGPVVWENGWLYADKKEHNGQDDMLLYKECSGEFEIIGNIYENPELIK